MRRKKNNEQRRSERVTASLPANMNGATVRTRDISASGIFVETDAAYGLGSPVRVVLDLDTPWGRVVFKCDGRIVRVEPHDSKVGVAVKFTDSETLSAP